MQIRLTSVVTALLLFCVLSYGVAQNNEIQSSSSTIDMLQKHDWVNQTWRNLKIRYDRDSMTYFSSINGENIVVKGPYYLSDKYEITFDSTKVGRNMNGQYIITETSIREIKILNDSLLVLKTIFIPKSILNYHLGDSIHIGDQPFVLGTTVLRYRSVKR